MVSMIMATTATLSHLSLRSYSQQLVCRKLLSPKPSNFAPYWSTDIWRNRAVIYGAYKENVVPKNKSKRIEVMSPDVPVSNFTVEILDATEDEYGGIVIDPNTLPCTSDAFAFALRASLSVWQWKGKKGIWMKLRLEQAYLIPIAVQEGFEFHHCEPGYLMLTYWIPNEPCVLPTSPSHHIGVGAIVINDKSEVLVVQEKCPCGCFGIWKIPTGYLNKSEEIFRGVIREVKEETGVDAAFLKLVAFRHAHELSFDKSDLMFLCMLKPLSHDITIDNNEIEAAKWMKIDELLGQPFYGQDQVFKRVMECCIAANEDCYDGFTAHRLMSKLDGKLSFLYYDHLSCF